jgi:hypothetical protein
LNKHSGCNDSQINLITYPFPGLAPKSSLAIVLEISVNKFSLKQIIK